MKRLSILIAIALFLSACGTTIHSVQLSPATIDFVEHRTFWSTTAVAIVRDGERIIGIGSGTGKPIASLAGDIATTGAIVGGMIFLGTHLKEINTGQSNVTVTGP